MQDRATCLKCGLEIYLDTEQNIYRNMYHCKNKLVVLATCIVVTLVAVKLKDSVYERFTLALYKMLVIIFLHDSGCNMSMKDPYCNFVKCEFAMTPS